MSFIREPIFGRKRSLVKVAKTWNKKITRKEKISFSTWKHSNFLSNLIFSNIFFVYFNPDSVLVGIVYKDLHELLQVVHVDVTSSSSHATSKRRYLENILLIRTHDWSSQFYTQRCHVNTEPSNKVQRLSIQYQGYMELKTQSLAKWRCQCKTTSPPPAFAAGCQQTTNRKASAWAMFPARPWRSPT